MRSPGASKRGESTRALPSAKIDPAMDRELSDAHENLRFGVRQVENGTLPRFELKAKRLLDERIVIGTEDERRSQA